MFRTLGTITGLISIYVLVSGSILAYQNNPMTPTDMLIIGVTLAVVSSLLINIAEQQGKKNGKDRTEQPSLPKS